MTSGTPYLLTWLAVDLASGRIAEDLPALTLSPPLSRRLGASTSSTFALSMAGAPPEWTAATDPGRTALVAVDPATSLPIWSGAVLPRTGGSGPTVRLAAATMEAYLDRRYPGAVQATATDISTVMQQVATPALTQGPALALDVTASGTLTDYAVLDSDDKSIGSCLGELAGLDGAPEWTVDTVWADAGQTAVQWVLRIRPTIGVQLAPPGAWFDFPGCVSDYSLTESYENGRGATSVLARGEADGSYRITSAPHVATDLLTAGWPLWEHRYQPASGIQTTGQLDAHATAALALLGTGSRAWTVEAVASQAPRLGSDWGLGDSIALHVESSPRHPQGTEVWARVYGWDLDPAQDKVTPILLEGA
ncbi:hypothetical protein [Kitasatospora sp. NPDC004272]